MTSSPAKWSGCRLIEEVHGLAADLLQTLGDRTVVLIAHEFRDLGQLGHAAEEQDDDDAFTPVKKGHEVAAQHLADDLSLGAVHGGKAVCELDEPDLDPRSSDAVELALEVLTG